MFWYIICGAYYLFAYWCAGGVLVIGCAPRGSQEWVGSIKSLCYSSSCLPAKRRRGAGGGGGVHDKVWFLIEHKNWAPSQVCATFGLVFAITIITRVLLARNQQNEKRHKSTAGRFVGNRTVKNDLPVLCAVLDTILCVKSFVVVVVRVKLYMQIRSRQFRVSLILCRTTSWL